MPRSPTNRHSWTPLLCIAAAATPSCKSPATHHALAQPTHTPPPLTCNVTLPTGLALTRCTSLDPTTRLPLYPSAAASLDELRREPAGRCELSEITLTFETTAGNDLNPDLVFTTPSGTTRRVKVGKPSRFTHNGLMARAEFGCDPEAKRVYGLNQMTGYLSAFDLAGNLLWQQHLPGFTALDDLDYPADSDTQVLFAALEQTASTAGGVHVLGQYVATQYWTRRHDMVQVVFNRSGALVGVIGPSNATLVGVDSAGWRLIGGFESLPAGVWPPTRPTWEAHLTPRDAPIEWRIEHFLAWLFPLQGDTDIVWHRCALLPPHRIRFRLGEQYDDAMAEEAKQIHDHLGVEWFNKVASRGRVSDVAARAAIDDPAWLAAWRQALLEAHVDVDFVAARNEPPLTTPTR